MSKGKFHESGALNWCRHHASNAGPTDSKSVAHTIFELGQLILVMRALVGRLSNSYIGKTDAQIHASQASEVEWRQRSISFKQYSPAQDYRHQMSVIWGRHPPDLRLAHKDNRLARSDSLTWMFED